MLITVFFYKINMSKFITLLLVLLLNYWELSSATTLRGARAKSGQFPWLIQFQTIAPCGGILVSPDWVLTAAQCVQYKRNSITLYASGLNGTGSRQTLGVKATYIFPQYKAYSTMHDYEHNIALLKLVKPFDMCDDKVELLDVAPVRLNDDYKKCLIFGWQSYVAPSTKVLAKPIQYSRVLLNAWKLCMYMLNGNTSYNNVFCTMIESEDGMKACAGNPGSPVVCEDRYQRLILLGIASWSNFSLDCGGIPTYLGVSVFRSWMYDLIFNDRIIQEWDNAGKSTSKGICGQDRYLGSIASGINTWNYSDLLESEHQRVNIDEKVVNRLLKPLEADQNEESSQDRTISSSRVVDIHSNEGNQHQINDYSEISSKYGISFNVVRERDDNLRQYQEVGQSKEAFSRIEDVFTSPTHGGESSNLGKPKKEEKSNKDVRKAVKIDPDDGFDDLEFPGPLDEDYFIGGSSSLRFSSREKSLLSILLLSSLSIVI